MLGFWLLVAPASVRGQDSSLLWPSPGPRAVTASQFAMRHAARAEVPLGTERTAPRAAARRSY
ncbi:MAG TPA: hypothetical protein VLD58_08815, partial [Gemmatimonadales bacterium]|nr:hypothetical protein [Gemmatimonadales bacterium]